MVKDSDSRTEQLRFRALPKGGNLECQKNTVRSIYKAGFGKEPEERYHYTPPVEPRCLRRTRPRRLRRCRTFARSAVRCGRMVPEEGVQGVRERQRAGRYSGFITNRASISGITITTCTG